MFCAKCGAELRESSLFCAACGTRVFNETESASSLWHQEQENQQPQPTVTEQSHSQYALQSDSTFKDPPRILDEDSNENDSCGVHASSSGVLQQSDRSAAEANRLPARKRRKLSVVLALCTLVVVVAGVVLFLLSGQEKPAYEAVSGQVKPAYEAVFVQDIYSISTWYDADKSVAYNTGWWSEYDDSGRLTEVTFDSFDSREANGYCTYAYDANGYVESMTYSIDIGKDATHYSGGMTFRNNIDERGRLAEAIMTSADGESLTASYAYYDDTDNLKSITYSDLKPSDGGAEWWKYTVGEDRPQFFIRGYMMPKSFDPAGLAKNIYDGVSSYETLEIFWSREGIWERIVANGVENERMWSGWEIEPNTRDDFRDKTVRFENDRGALEYVYDLNGNLVKESKTYAASGDRVYPGLEVNISWIPIAEPSRSVYIFNRLLS